MVTIFDNLAKSPSNKSFISEDERQLSYKDLINDANCFSEKLNQRSLIFIVTRNNYNCIVGYVGAIRSNVVIALINESIHETLFIDLIVKFKPSMIYKPQNILSCNNNWNQCFHC